MQGATDIETGELILTVDEEDLGQLVDLMLRPKATVISIEGAPKYSGTRPITSLRVAIDTGDGVVIEVGHDSASMTGRALDFERLAREIRRFGFYNDLREPGMHSHFDPGDRSNGEVAVSTRSAPLVLVGPVSDEPEPEA